jgi:membrane associated rhomboid family serine protease
MRALTIVNLSLWVVLFLAWIPYTALVGFTDQVSGEVRWILTISAFLMALLFALRVHRRRPVLG